MKKLTVFKLNTLLSHAVIYVTLRQVDGKMPLRAQLRSVFDDIRGRLILTCRHNERTMEFAECDAGSGRFFYLTCDPHTPGILCTMGGAWEIDHGLDLNLLEY